MRRLLLASLGLLLYGSSIQPGRAVTIDFDGMSGSSAGTPYPGDAFTSLGLTLRSGEIPDAVNTGDIVTFVAATSGADEFLLFDTDAPSFPNIASASGGCRLDPSCTSDLLFEFANPIPSLSLTTDTNVGGPTPVRLVALAETGETDRFLVLAIAETLDSSPADRLSVTPDSPFRFAAFQATGEREGFDDLDFVPEPSTALLVASGIALAAIRQRALRRSGPSRQRRP
jgi:hypothetical protein